MSLNTPLTWAPNLEEAIEGNPLTLPPATPLAEAIAQHQPIIYDATNCSRKDRIAFLQTVESLPQVHWVAVQVDTPLHLCKQRNQQRDRQVPEHVIEMMAEQLQAEPPTCIEGFRRVLKVHLNHLRPALG
jgi:predicted kinase